MPFRFHSRETGVLHPRRFLNSLTLSENQLDCLAVSHTLEHPTPFSGDISFSQDGQYLLTSDFDRKLTLWDWAKGTQAIIFSPEHEQTLRMARILPHSDNSSIVSFGADDKVVVSSFYEGSSYPHNKSLPSHMVFDIAMDTSQPNVFATCGNGEVRQVDLRCEQNHQIKIQIQGSNSQAVPLYAIDVNPNNSSLVVVGGQDGLIRLLDVRNFKNVDGNGPQPRAASEPIDTNQPVLDVNYSPKGELVVSYYKSHLSLFGNPAEDVEPQQTYLSWAHGDLRECSFFGLNSEYVVSSSRGGVLAFWGKKNGKLMAAKQTNHHGAFCFAVHPSAPVLATCRGASGVRIWDLSKGG